MTYVARVEFENYGRFRGEHVVELGPSVYGIVATTVADERRSNWQGKSTFLNAVAHALFGWHDFASEDGWISYGEKRGRLVVTTSDGWSYKRERPKGKSTQFYLDGPGGKLSGDAAQAEVARIVGLGEQDFFATCFFRQKQMSGFVSMDPAPRFKVVVGWLGLERGERCAANAQARLAKALDRARKVADRLAYQQELASKMRSVEELEAEVVAAHEAWVKAKAEEGNLVRYDRAEAFDGIDADGRRERAKLDELKAHDVKGRGAIVKRALVAYAAMVEARSAYERAEQVARGEFSGECPVSGKGCPIAAEINAGNAEASARCKTLEMARFKRRTEHEDAAAKLQLKRSRRKQRLLSWWRLQELKRRALELLPDHRWAKANPLGTERPNAEEAFSAHVNAQMVVDRAKELAIELERLKAERVAAEQEVELARAAVKSYRGALRLVAESRLAQIEAGANGLLADAGVELAVKMAWAREGGGLATQCVECGYPFPPSQRVKACERCAAARGPKLVEKLSVELSDRSGAAEDLGGMAAMLSASAWLRERRGAAWGSAFLDEPVGACDAFNRRAVVGYVAGMLRGRLGFEQGFLVAHTRDALDTLPGRVTIVGDGKWSRFE